MTIRSHQPHDPFAVATLSLPILAWAVLSLMAFRAVALEPGTGASAREAGAAFYAAVEGHAGNEGTADSPWDMESALGGQHAIAPGSTLYRKGGTYRRADRRWESPGLAIALVGAPGRPIDIRPIPGHRVTLDGKVEVKPNARHLRVWELEITASETAT